MSDRIRDERGVALVIVLTIVALLTITVMEFTYNVQLDHLRTRNSLNAMQSKLLARSGINLVETFLAQDEEDLFDAFTEDWALALEEFCAGIQLEPTMRLRCGWEDESGKININMMRPKGPPRNQMAAGAPARPDQVIRDAIIHILRIEDLHSDEIEEAFKKYWEADYLNKSSDEKEKFAPDIGSLEDFAALFEIAPGKLQRLRRFLTAQSNRRVSKVNANTAPEEVLSALLVGDYGTAGGEEALQQILEGRKEAAFENAAALKATLGGVDPSVQKALEGILDVKSKCFRLQASGLTNADPTGVLEGGIGQTLNALVCRTKKLNQQGARNNQQFVWTFKRLDWQKEAGARLFRQPVRDPLDSDD